MSQYVLVVIWIAILYIISQFMNVYTTEDVCGKQERRVRIGFVVLAIIPLVLWTATRTINFGDTGVYLSGFRRVPITFTEIIPYIEGVEKDKGFTVLVFIIKKIIGDNPIFYFGSIATIQIVCLTMVFRKYSSDFVMSLFLFVATSDYIAWMHNGIRQFVAVTMVFAATELMLQKKYVKLIMIILLAATIHGSALIMLPIVFITQGNPWNSKTLMAIGVFVVAIICIEQFTDLMNVLLEDTQYTDVVSNWQTLNDDGTNPIRVLIYSIPTIFSLWGLRFIRNENSPIINLSCNMGIIATMFYCLSVFTSGIYIGRIPIYCSLYSMGILLPWETNNMFTRTSAKLIKLMMIFFFIAFYYFQVSIAWGLF